MAHSLAGRLDRGGFADVIVSFGGSGISPWAGFRCALGEALSFGADYAMLFEDDAEPCDGFRAVMECMVRRAPEDVIYFFATRSQAGDEMDSAFGCGDVFARVTESVVGTVAVCLPMGVVRRFLRQYAIPGVDEDFRRRYSSVEHAGDARLYDFLTGVLGKALLVTARSFVGHGCAAQHESIAHETCGPPRLAYRPVPGVAGEMP